MILWKNEMESPIFLNDKYDLYDVCFHLNIYTATFVFDWWLLCWPEIWHWIFLQIQVSQYVLWDHVRFICNSGCYAMDIYTTWKEDFLLNLQIICTLLSVFSLKQKHYKCSIIPYLLCCVICAINSESFVSKAILLLTEEAADIQRYRQTFIKRLSKSQHLTVTSLVLWLSLPNTWKPGVKSRMKMRLEQHRQAILQPHLSDQQFHCLLKCVLYEWSLNFLFKRAFVLITITALCLQTTLQIFCRYMPLSHETT